MRLRSTSTAVLGRSEPQQAEEPENSDYFADMSIQMYGWEQLFYLEWWGN